MKIRKAIPGYGGLYEASEDGEIWSNKNRIHNGKFLKPSLRKGYKFVCLCLGSEVHMRSIHRLVAYTFIPNPKNLPQINHIDGDKLNNNVSNLEWCTASENKQHSWDIGTTVTTPAKSAASRNNAAIARTYIRRSKNV